MKIRSKRLLVLAGILVTGWLTWLALTSTPAPKHPFYLASGFDVIAHRGGAGMMPENTLEALILAERLGSDILEMDIRLTKDQQIVLIHDETLNRTTTCEGPVSQVTLADLSRCKIENQFPIKYVHVTAEKPDREKSFLTVPTLESVFQKFPTKHMVIEIKENKPELITGFCTLIHHYHKSSHVLVGSFHQSALDLFRLTCPQVATSATPKEATTFVLLSKLRMSGLLSPAATALQLPRRFTAKKNSIMPNFEIVTASLVQQAHAKNLAVQVWTINEVDEMKALIQLGVDGIMTDFPDRLLSVSRPPQNQ